MLKVRGFVQLLPYGGTIIKQINPKEVHETLELKVMVESYATDIFTSKADTGEISQLEATLKEVKKQVKRGSLLRLLYYNARFHKQIVNRLNNEKLPKCHETLIAPTTRFFASSFFEKVNWGISAKKSKEIVDGMKRRGAAKAAKAALRHVLNTIERVFPSSLRRWKR